MPTEKELSINNISIVNDLSPTIIMECESFLENNAQANFYHHPLWLKILSEESGQPLFLIIHRDNNGIIDGLMPALATKGIPFMASSILSDKRLASLPRTPYAGPVSSSSDVINYLLDEAITIYKRLNKNSIQIKTFERLDLLNPKYKSFEWRKLHVKQLSDDNSITTFQDGKARKSIFHNINKAKENHIIFRRSESIDDLKTWYQFYLEVMRLHKVPPRSLKFFLNCWNLLIDKNMIDLNLAIKDKGNSHEILGGNINFKFKNKYFGAFKAGNKRKSFEMYGDFILFSEFERLIEQGYISYDMGEVPNGNLNLDRYKSKWGTEKLQLYHNYYSDVINLENIEQLEFYKDDSEDKSKQLWRKIPLKLTEFIGNQVNRRL